MAENTQKHLYKEFSFPHAERQFAKLTFSVELSPATDIKWDATWRGLLSFFALCSHETYLELAELFGKITHSQQA